MRVLQVEFSAYPPWCLCYTTGKCTRPVWSKSVHADARSDGHQASQWRYARLDQWYIAVSGYRPHRIL